MKTMMPLIVNIKKTNPLYFIKSTDSLSVL